jgi:DNA topoisomerase-1
MQLAQRLYEPDLSHMRTDSVNLSKDAMEAAQAEIIKSYGKSSLNLELLSIKVKNTRSARGDSSHGYVPSYGEYRQRSRLYDLIWKERWLRK